MKRIVNILLILMSSVVYTAQAENTDVHLKQLVQCMDADHYECVMEEMPKVKDWSPISEWIDTYKAISVFYDIKFATYEDSSLVSAELIDSLALFIARDSKSVASYYRDKDEYEIANDYAEIAIDFYAKAKQLRTEEYAEVLIEAGEINEDMDEIATAERYYLKALALYEKEIGEKSRAYVYLLHVLGSLYDDIEEYADAEQLYLKALHIHEKVYKKKLGSYAGLLNDIGVLYLDMGDYAKAEQYYLKSLSRKKKQYGPKSTNYADTEYNLGRLYAKTKDYEKAQRYHLAALQLREELKGKESKDYAASARELASVYIQKGEDENGVHLYKESLESYKKVFGSADHPNCIEILDSISKYYVTRENHDSAFSYSGQFYVAAMHVYGDSSEIGAKAIFRYATVLQERYYLKEQAIKMYRRAANAFNAVYGESNIPYAQCLMALAHIFIQSSEELEEVENYLNQAEKIISTTLGRNNKTYVTCLKAYGDYYFAINDREKGAEYYVKASKIVKDLGYDADRFLQDIIAQHNEKVNGIYDSDLSKLIKEYFYDQQSFNRFYSWSEILISGQLLVDKLYKGVYSDAYIYSLIQLGYMYMHYGKPLDSRPYIQSYSSLIKQKYIRSVDYMSEAQRASFWKQYECAFNGFVPEYAYRAYPLNDSIAIIAYDNELFVKGLLLSSANAIKNSILASGDTTLIRQWNELTKKKQQIMALEQKGPQSAYLTQVKEEAESLEKAITRKSATYRENMQQWAITWDSVRATLKPNQVAIEYMRAPLNEDSTMYCALLLRDTCSYPIMIPLFEEKEVSRLLHRATNDKQTIHITYTYDQNGQQLSQLIWSKVLPYIKDSETVFFSPTGILHQIAIENLPYSRDNCISDRYNLVRLSSTRELAMTGQAIPHQTATLYGGILYGPMDTTIMIANATRYRSLESTAQHISPTDTIQRSIALYLPGSKAEIDSIQPILAKKKIAVTVYSQYTACEESFKAQSGKQPNILLLSTHGFFWQDSTARQERYFRQRAIMQGEDDFRTVTSIDPLERCGLLFAGANTALSGHSDRLPRGVDDGILTAKEISVLDFRKTDIVVMSACETGLGDISGEGVFGLQRAFKMAGAKTIMMTLWQVNDRATNLFMTSFFRHYSQGMSKREAFRAAQQEVRSYTGEVLSSESKALMSGKERMQSKSNLVSTQQAASDGSEKPSAESAQPTKDEHPYASPYYWAGFVLLD